MRLSALAALVALAAAVAVAGCERDPTRADAAAQPSFLLVSLPSLGTATWRCAAREDRYGLAFRVFRSGATTDLRLIQGKRVVQRATIQPGDVLRLPALGLTQRVELTQRTGAGILEASLFVRFDRAPVVSHCFAYSPPHLVVRVAPRG